METKTVIRRSISGRRSNHDIDIKELIHRYKQYECLWNSNSIYYKNNAFRKEAWQEVANYFHRDVSEIKLKMKYLRSAYILEKKKVMASKRKGKSYKPSLFYYNELDFLDNVVIWRKRRNDEENKDLEYESVEIVPEERDDFIGYDNDDEDIDNKSPVDTCKIEAYTEYTPNSSPKLTKNDSLANIQTSTTSSSRTNKKRKHHHHESVMPNKSQSYSTSTLGDKNNQLCDLYNSFGKTISLHLKQLPLEIAVVTMSDIHTILTKKTLEHIKSTQNGNETYSQSDSDNSFSELVDGTLEDSYY